MLLPSPDWSSPEDGGTASSIDLSEALHFIRVVRWDRTSGVPGLDGPHWNQIADIAFKTRDSSKALRRQVFLGDPKVPSAKE